MTYYEVLELIEIAQSKYSTCLMIHPHLHKFGKNINHLKSWLKLLLKVFPYMTTGFTGLKVMIRLPIL